mmetsp:Transcript_31363/g.48671  ORF Transcript_31363/g.48671 Transcript_31363/m.48671 type:complete len:137 (+) Transcript_31363:43-453(+)
MAGAQPLRRKKIIKKRTAKFTRFECEDFKGMKNHWRKPRGIDNRMRRKFRGNKPMVSVGYGSDNKTKFVLPAGFKKFLIKCPKDLEILLMNNRTFIGELAHSLSARTKAAIVRRAAELNVRLTNSKGKLKTEEKKS